MSKQNNEKGMYLFNDFRVLTSKEICLFILRENFKVKTAVRVVVGFLIKLLKVEQGNRGKYVKK